MSVLGFPATAEWAEEDDDDEEEEDDDEEDDCDLDLFLLLRGDRSRPPILMPLPRFGGLSSSEILPLACKSMTSSTGGTVICVAEGIADGATVCSVDGKVGGTVMVGGAVDGGMVADTAMVGGPVDGGMVAVV